jgi:hypothetical protein
MHGERGDQTEHQIVLERKDPYQESETFVLERKDP